MGVGDKKKIDEKWIMNAIDMTIGPFMAVLFSRDETKGGELLTIITSAIRDLYENNEYETTNQMVIAVSDRIWELYNTFMTARLIDRFDNGMPEKPSLILVKGNGELN